MIGAGQVHNILISGIFTAEDNELSFGVINILMKEEPVFQFAYQMVFHTAAIEYMK